VAEVTKERLVCEIKGKWRYFFARRIYEAGVSYIDAVVYFVLVVRLREGFW